MNDSSHLSTSPLSSAPPSETSSLNGNTQQYPTLYTRLQNQGTRSPTSFSTLPNTSSTGPTQNITQAPNNAQSRPITTTIPKFTQSSHHLASTTTPITGAPSKTNPAYTTTTITSTSTTSSTSPLSSSSSAPPTSSLYSPATAQILARISGQRMRDYGQARSHVLSSIVTADQLPPLPPTANGGRGPGRPPGRAPAVSGYTSGGSGNALALGPPASEADSAHRGGPAREVQHEPRAVPLAKGRGRPRKRKSAGTARRRKRRRQDALDEDVDDDDEDEDTDDSIEDMSNFAIGSADRTQASLMRETSETTSEEGIQFPLKTKSGRSVHPPSAFVPSPRTATSNSLVASGGTSTGSLKRKVGRPSLNGKRNFSQAGITGTVTKQSIEIEVVCKSCDRGHSPKNNAVVFCDGCGTAYHQFCHDPPIAKDVIEIPDKEWVCSECERVTRKWEGVKLGGQFRNTFVTGAELNSTQKTQTLKELDKSQLIDLLLEIHTVYPNIAMFPPRNTKGSKDTDAASGNADTHQGNLDDGSTMDNNEVPYDGYETDPPAHYPKPGHGLARTLAPETDDAPWLVDGNLLAFQQVDLQANGSAVGAKDETSRHGKMG